MTIRPISSAHEKRYLDSVISDLDVRDGVAVWAESGNVLFPDAALYFAEAHGIRIDLDAQVAAKRAQDRAAIAAYVAAQPAEPTAEERFEARAAFGAGAEVVDVFTGRRFTA